VDLAIISNVKEDESNGIIGLKPSKLSIKLIIPQLWLK